MYRIKLKYWIVLAVFTLLASILVYVDTKKELIANDQLNLVIALAAILISLFAIGLSDPAPMKLKIKVEMWFTAKNENSKDKTYRKFAFGVTNNSWHPIKNLIINFRMPSRIINPALQHDQIYNEFKYAESIILNNDDFKYLGVREDKEARYEHFLYLDEWEKGNIYVSVTGDEHESKTYKVSPSNKEGLLTSSSNNRVQLKSKW